MPNESLPAFGDVSNRPRTALRALRLAGVGMFAAWMLVEWSMWPKGSEFLGPLGLIWYGRPDPCSLAPCAVLLPPIFAFPFRPRVWTAIVSGLGLLAWTF